MIHRIVGKFLKDSAAIRNRVGSRIYLERVPQDAPAGERLVISKISGERFYTLDNEADATNAIMEVACYADDPTRAESLWDLVRNRLSGYHGEVTYLSNGSDATTWISSTIIRDGMDVTDPNDASDKWKFGYSGDFSIYYHHAVPDHT